MESENTAGAEATETTETEEHSTGIEHLGELLQESEAAGAEEQERGGSEENGPVTKFNDLAGKAGIELDDLYKLEISTAADGETVTIENLKDAWSKQDDFVLREIEFEERVTEREAELMQAQEEIREILGALPEKAVKPEVIEKIRARHQEKVDIEKRRTLEIIPAWADKETRTADMQGMTEQLKRYGFPANYLAHVADHRQMKYIRDNYLREQRIKAAMEKVRPGKPNPTGKSKASKKAPTKQTVTNNTRPGARSTLKDVFANL